jgi:acetolactate synthase-1/2/3 large subunit
MKIKVSDYIADFMATHGVEHVFTVTGGGAMHLNDSLGHHKDLKCVYNHHEQACALAAEGYMRYSKKLPLVCVTSGPGGTNALTGVLGAWLDSIPMFIISGQVKRATTIHATTAKVRQVGDQEFNITDCVASMTKYAKFVDNAVEIAYHLEKALYLCKNGRGGPVWLDLPLDIQAAIVDTEELVHFSKEECSETVIYDQRNTSQIIEQIRKAKRPVILAGTGIRLAGARDEFIKMVDKLGVPVVTAWNAHDVIWDEHPLYVGRPGTVGTRGGNFVVQNSDLLISLGCRLNIRQISYNYDDFAKDAYKIIVDIDAEELKKHTVHPDLPIHADVKDVIHSLLECEYEGNNEKHKEWVKWCRKTDAKYPVALPEYYEKKSPINPYVFMRKLFENLNENETIITGNGSACVCSFQAAIIKKGTRLFTNSGSATMGYGVPAALGASFAKHGERVICLDGDGSIQMNLQELQTIVYNNANIKIFVLNNDGYHSMRQTQSNLFKGALAGVNKENGVSFPDMEKIAYAYGIPYYRINGIEQIDEIVQKVINLQSPVLCEAMLDKEQFFAPKLSSKVLPDGTIVSPAIDDLSPFLSREEYLENKEVCHE